MSNEPRYLEGKHAVVTGGSRGIGASVAEWLARRGAAVTILARDGEAAAWKAADLAKSSGTAAGGIACDVADEGMVRHAFEIAVQERGPVAILVNNAGIAESAPFAQTTRMLWDRIIGVDLTGAYSCTAQVVDGMVKANWGRIVNVASTAGLRGYKTMTAYCAAKHGLVGFTRALSAELAKKGVTVNAVCPGYVETDIAGSAVRNLVDRLSKSEEEARAMLVKPIPLGRLTTPDEVASAVDWLCSEGAASVTGIALPIAGGEVQ